MEEQDRLMKDYRQTRQGTNQLSEKTSDKLQDVKLNRSKIIINNTILFIFTGQRIAITKKKKKKKKLINVK